MRFGYRVINLIGGGHFFISVVNWPLFFCILCSLESGYRESGLTLGKAGKIVLAVRTTAISSEVPLTDASENLMVDRKYVEFLVRLSNLKLKENNRRIRLFEEKCKNCLFG